MSSRQDQLHSYQFMIQRVVAALVLRDTDPARSPMRRLAGTALASVLIAAIGVGAMAVYGALTGSGRSDWREAGGVIVEKETGARYVYRDGTLHPVRNYTSGLLLVQGGGATVPVARSALAGVPRGGPLGITDAPDSLPAPGQLAGAPWTVCSTASEGAPPRSALLVGRPPEGGRVLGDDAILARHPDGGLHLIWHQRRYLLRDAAVALAALAATPSQAVPVAPALLNALPAGADLGRITIEGAGRPSPHLSGARVGDVFVATVPGGGRQYAVAVRTGLAPITELQASLLLSGGTNRQVTAAEIAQGQLVALQVPDLVPGGPTAPPPGKPQLVAAAADTVCGVITDDSGVGQVRYGVAPVETGGGRPGGGAELVDHIAIAPGQGAVVEAVAAPGAAGGGLMVVTDLGARHAVADRQVLDWLGYAGVAPTRIPAAVVALVPAGVPLDPAAAEQPAQS